MYKLDKYIISKIVTILQIYADDSNIKVTTVHNIIYNANEKADSYRDTSGLLVPVHNMTSDLPLINEKTFLQDFLKNIKRNIFPQKPTIFFIRVA